MVVNLEGEGALGEKSSHPVDTNSQRAERWLEFVASPNYVWNPYNIILIFDDFEFFLWTHFRGEPPILGTRGQLNSFAKMRGHEKKQDLLVVNLLEHALKI